MSRLLIVSVLAIFVTVHAAAQQVPDTAFRPSIERPTYAEGKGPVVLLDEAHFNFHTASGRYQPFADLLRRDGYVVNTSTQRFSGDALKAGRVLVIANALHGSNKEKWAPPNPSAFTAEEIAALKQWIADGGSLLLIADHAPFAGAAMELGQALGVRFRDGYVSRKGASGPLVFGRDPDVLGKHAVSEGVTEVATFTGSSFELTVPGDPIFVLGPGTISMRPPDESTAVDVSGHLQGAVFTLGKGRVAVFGEAAMFSAQLAGPEKRPMGMNAPAAKQNPRFLLNVMRWLAGTPSPMGVKYRFRSDSLSGTAWVLADDARLEIESGEGGTAAGRVELWTDAGHQVLMLAPSQRSYYDGRAFAARSGVPLGTFATLTVPSPFSVEAVENVQVDSRMSPRTEYVGGLSCRRVVVKFSYDLRLSLKGANAGGVPAHVEGTDDLCLAEVPEVQWRALPRSAFASGHAQVDAAVAAQLKAVGGIPVARMLKATRRIENGETISGVSGFLISDVERVPIDPAIFAVPTGYRRQDPAIQPPVRR